MISDEDREIAAMRRAVEADELELDPETLARIMDEDDGELVAPYRKRVKALRAAGEDERAIYEALLRLADRRGDDYAEVFAVLYGDGSILPPSEAL